MKISVVRSKSDGRYIATLVFLQMIWIMLACLRRTIASIQKVLEASNGPSAFDENFEAVEVWLPLNLTLDLGKRLCYTDGRQGKQRDISQGAAYRPLLLRMVVVV